MSQGIRNVLEIGPGGGALTKELLSKGFAVTAVEKDSRFAELLVESCKGSFAPGASLMVVNDDVLKFDLSKWLTETNGVRAVCGNIPYNISSSIMQWVIPVMPNLECAIFMVQKEFARRLVAVPSTKDYGSLSVYAQLRAKLRILFDVPREIFKPVPKVDSAVFIMSRPDADYSDRDLADSEKVTRFVFTQRRKMLRNSLGKLTDLSSESELPIDLNRRPDSLTPVEFVELARALHIQG
jgi:16S rRNA (adenine1518-N6/adenine1519-N6)-dimethyltransferase